MIKNHDYNFANWGSINSTPEMIQDVPPRTGDIKSIMIQEKLHQLGVLLDDVCLGNFDQIGEHTARKTRDSNSKLYKSVGCFFRPNYERGILIYHLIKKYEIESFLEVGFGRGYSTFCAAMAMEEMGKGKITAIDPNFNESFLSHLRQIFPDSWFSRIDFIKNTSRGYLSDLGPEKRFDFVYIDGDHTYDAVKFDWENTKDRFNKLLLFDDYHLPSKNDSGAGIQCSNLIDQIDDESKELIIMDRRIFLDDRSIPDHEIDYGQVLLTKT